MDSLTLLLVADDPLARAGLAALLADLPDCEIAAQVSSRELADETVLVDLTAEWPDAIVWDVGWEPPPTLPERPEWGAPVVWLLADVGDAPLGWVGPGTAVLSRETEPDTLLAAIRAVVQGLVVLDLVTARTMLPAPNVDDPALAESLTPREQEVLQLLAEGLTNKAIGQRLDISEHTVKFHVNAVMGKLGAQSRTEAVVRATRLGLIVL